MVDPFRGIPYSFRALSKTYGPMWVRCDVCRRYVRLKLAGLHDVDYRTKTFSCSRCGAAAYIAVIEPIKETGMEDYRLEEIEGPTRHPAAVDRLLRHGRRCGLQSTSPEENCLWWHYTYGCHREQRELRTRYTVES